MIKSRVDNRRRTTLPRQVCAALGLQAGEEIVYAIETRRVVLTRAVENPFDAFFEWDGDADTKAYRDL